MMHDWTLIEINIDWSREKVVLKLSDNQEIKYLTAHEFVSLSLGRHEEWGPSKSVNEVNLFAKKGDRYKKLVLEVQSGDKLQIEAAEFDIPSE